MEDEFYGENEYFGNLESVRGDNDNDEQENDENQNINEDELNEFRGDKTMSMLNPKSVRERIDETLEILKDLKSRTDIRLSRADLLVTLSKDLSEYYGYLPELSDFLLELFSPAECVEFMDSNDRPRPLVIRANTLKTTRKTLMEALTKRGVIVESIDWSKVAIKITESTVPIGATPEYLAGHYMLQSAASMNPVLALAPQPSERILDMAAAPGGKTSYIAQLMKNSGLIIANDLKPQRQKATIANLHRLGVKNSIVCCYDGRKIPKIMKGFDRVLLDAPCSGLGVISRDQSVKIQRTIRDIQRIAHLQKELLCAAVDAVDMKSSSGGIVVYSTCSISVEENEQVIEYILSKRYVRLVDTGLTVGKPGFTRYQHKRFHSSLSLTRRFYPHVHNMDGFFVAKLQKFGNGSRETNENEDENEEEQHEFSKAEDFEAFDNTDGEYNEDGILKQSKNKKRPRSKLDSSESKDIASQEEITDLDRLSSQQEKAKEIEVAVSGDFKDVKVKTSGKRSKVVKANRAESLPDTVSTPQKSIDEVTEIGNNLISSGEIFDRSIINQGQANVQSSEVNSSDSSSVDIELKKPKRKIKAIKETFKNQNQEEENESTLGALPQSKEKLVIVPAKKSVKRLPLRKLRKV